MKTMMNNRIEALRALGVNVIATEANASETSMAAAWAAAKKVKANRKPEYLEAALAKRAANEAAKEAAKKALASAKEAKAKASKKLEAETKTVDTVVAATPTLTVGNAVKNIGNAVFSITDIYEGFAGESCSDAAFERMAAKVRVQLLTKLNLAATNADKQKTLSMLNTAKAEADKIPALKNTNILKAEKAIIEAEAKLAEFINKDEEIKMEIALSDPENYIITRFHNPNLSDEANEAILKRFQTMFNPPKGIEYGETWIDEETGETFSTKTHFIFDENNPHPPIYIPEPEFWARTMPWYEAQQAAEEAIMNFFKTGMDEKIFNAYQSLKTYISETWLENHYNKLNELRKLIRSTKNESEKKKLEKELEAEKVKRVSDTPEYQKYIEMRNIAAESSEEVQAANDAYMKLCWYSEAKFFLKGENAEYLRFFLTVAELNAIASQDKMEANLEPVKMQIEQLQKGEIPEELREQWYAQFGDKETRANKEIFAANLALTAIRRRVYGLFKTLGIVDAFNDKFKSTDSPMTNLTKEQILDYLRALPEDPNYTFENEGGESYNMSLSSLFRLGYELNEATLLSFTEFRSLFNISNEEFKALSDKMIPIIKMEQKGVITCLRGKYFVLSLSATPEKKYTLTGKLPSGADVVREFSSLTNLGVFYQIGKIMKELPHNAETSQAKRRILAALAGNVVSPYKSIRAYKNDGHIPAEVRGFKRIIAPDFKGSEYETFLTEEYKDYIKYSDVIDSSVWEWCLEDLSVKDQIRLSLNFDPAPTLNEDIYKILLDKLLSSSDSAERVLTQARNMQFELEYDHAWGKLLEERAHAIKCDMETAARNAALQGKVDITSTDDDQYATGVSAIVNERIAHVAEAKASLVFWEEKIPNLIYDFYGI